MLEPTVNKAGIGKHVTAHVFRHSYATHLIEAGADLRSVQVLMGHASIQSTARYVHLTTARMLSISSPLVRIPMKSIACSDEADHVIRPMPIA